MTLYPFKNSIQNICSRLGLSFVCLGANKDDLGAVDLSLANQIDEGSHLMVVAILDLLKVCYVVGVEADQKDAIVKEEEPRTAYIFLEIFRIIFSNKPE